MGYLSCKAESSILTSNSQTKTNNNQNPSKPIIEIQEFHYTDLQTATNSFSKLNLLGRGSHGSVYKGLLHGNHLVAIKKSSRQNTQKFTTKSSAICELENEFDILSKLQSPRVVNLVGFTPNPIDRLLVVEFMPNGTLFDYLHTCTRPPNWGRRIKLSLQTAKAIDTIHSLVPPVIHRDIKSANILLDNNYNAKLSDFGLALRCHVDDYRLRSTPPAGTMGYLDPGYVTPDNLSTKNDVFSFGILLLEIISGRKAIDVGFSPPYVVDWAIPLIRRGKFSSVFDPRLAPPKDPLLRKHLAVIAAKCVRSCRERRPSMKEVVESLSGLSKLVPLHSWNGFSNPCLMVETVGRPVELKNTQVNFKAKDGEEEGSVDGKFSRSLRNSRRVYSDLGFRNNLIDLMAGSDGESQFWREADDVEHKSELQNGGSSFKIESSRIVSKKKQSVSGPRQW